MSNVASAWNLSELYKGVNDPNLSRDFRSSNALIAKLKTYRSKIATISPEDLLLLIRQWEQLAFTFHKIDLYAGLLESTHVDVPDITRFVKKIDEMIVTKGKEIIFIEVELAQLPEKTWQTHLAAEVLAPYRTFLRQIHEQAKHTLSEPEEKILAEKSQTSWLALSHLYKITTDTLLFDWEDNKLTLEELLTKFYDPNPDVRKKAAMVLHNGLKQNDRTTPAIYNALVQDKSINDRLRHHSYPEESRFLSDDVDRETVEAMVTTVSNSYHLIETYYTRKKTILRTDKLHWWDRYAPLPELKTKIDAPQAREMVVDAYQEFSPRMADVVQGMYDKNHIDWFPSPQKQGGAFCAMSGRDIYPYVLLNYTATPRDVMTLAHELGHAVHDVLAQTKNTFFQTHPSLALAEIASIFGEFLVFERLIRSDLPKQDRTALIMAFIEDAFASTFRQTTMFQFEQAIHARRRAEGELSKEHIDTLWHELMSKPFVSSLEYTNEHRNTWMYVKHVFSSPFYVYSYSFAKLCVLSLIQQYREKGKAFIPVYLRLLEAGGSLSPKENLAQAGLDITSSQFWQDGLKVIEEYIHHLDRS